MAKSKIVLLSAAFPYRGGIAQFTEYLANELENNHEVDVVTFKRQYPNLLFPGKTQFVTESDSVPKKKPKRWVDTVNPFNYIATANKIVRLKPTVYISRYWMPFFAPSMGFIAKKLKGKCLRLAILDNVVPHEKRKFDKKLTRYFLKNHDGFICLSQQVKNELLDFYPNAKVKLINHPIYDQFGEKIDKAEALRKLNLTAEKKYILFFGFIRKYKGLDVLLEAMKNVDPSVELIVAGEVYGSFEKYIEIINKHQLSSRVHLFTDYIPDSEIALYFSASEALILPYHSATQSGLSALGLNFEIPSIATNVGGLSEVVKHKINGLLLEPNNPKALSEAINQYFEEHMKNGFIKALKQEKESYSWTNFVENLEDFIKEFD